MSKPQVSLLPLCLSFVLLATVRSEPRPVNSSVAVSSSSPRLASLRGAVLPPFGHFSQVFLFYLLMFFFFNLREPRPVFFSSSFAPPVFFFPSWKPHNGCFFFLLLFCIHFNLRKTGEKSYHPLMG